MFWDKNEGAEKELNPVLFSHCMKHEYKHTLHKAHDKIETIYSRLITFLHDVGLMQIKTKQCFTDPRLSSSYNFLLLLYVEAVHRQDVSDQPDQGCAVSDSLQTAASSHYVGIKESASFAVRFRSVS